MSGPLEYIAKPKSKVDSLSSAGQSKVIRMQEREDIRKTQIDQHAGEGKTFIQQVLADVELSSISSFDVGVA